MSYVSNILFNNGAFIKISSNKVRRRPNDLDASRVCLMVGPGPREARQEGVMDVDDLIRELGDHVRTENLHVARQHDQLDALLFDQLDDARLLRRLLLRRALRPARGPRGRARAPAPA